LKHEYCNDQTLTLALALTLNVNPNLAFTNVVVLLQKRSSSLV